MVLPAYRIGQAVQPIHLMMVRKQLADVGMIKPGELVLRARAKAALKVKTIAKPSVEAES